MPSPLAFADSFRASLLVRFATLVLLTVVALGAAGPVAAKDKYRVAWTIYVGWMPWDYAASSGIMKKWADKYGIEIELVQVNDYVESINQYTAGSFDACVMTNMDALTIPAAGGVDSTALIVGDFSNGNDGVVLKGKTKLADIKGQKVNLVELRSRTTCWPAPSRRRLERARRHGRQHLRRRHRRGLRDQRTSRRPSPGTRCCPRSWRSRTRTRSSTRARSRARSST